MKQPSKDELLAAKPKRMIDNAPHPAGEGRWRLTLPLRASKSASWLLRIPHGRTKTFELDAIGKSVWDFCDGEKSVEQIIRKLAAEYNLNQRECEVATLA